MAIDLRRAFFTRAMKLVRHPRVARALGSTHAMDAFVYLVQAKERGERALRRIADRLRGA
jgi:hypothetical protein